MNTNQYLNLSPNTLETMLEAAEKRAAKECDPALLTYADADLASVQATVDAFEQVKEVLKKRKGFLKNSVILATGEIDGMLGELADRARAARENALDQQRDIKRAKAEVDALTQATSDRAEEEKSIRGGFLGIGKPFGSSAKWSKEEFEMVRRLLALSTKTGIAATITGQEAIRGEFAASHPAAKDAIRQWVKGNFVRLAGLAPIRVRSKTQGEVVGYTLHRMLLEKTGGRTDFVVDQAAKSLRIWIDRNAIQEVLRSVGVSAGGDLPPSFYDIDGDGLHPVIYISRPEAGSEWRPVPRPEGTPVALQGDLKRPEGTPVALQGDLKRPEGTPV